MSKIVVRRKGTFICNLIDDSFSIKEFIVDNVAPLWDFWSEECTTRAAKLKLLDDVDMIYETAKVRGYTFERVAE